VCTEDDPAPRAGDGYPALWNNRARCSAVRACTCRSIEHLRHTVSGALTEEGPVQGQRRAFFHRLLSRIAGDGEVCRHRLIEINDERDLRKMRSG